MFSRPSMDSDLRFESEYLKFERLLRYLSSQVWAKFAHLLLFFSTPKKGAKKATELWCCGSPKKQQSQFSWFFLLLCSQSVNI